jgi:hypothetical protein
MNPKLVQTTLGKIDVHVMVCLRNCVRRPLIEIQYYQSSIVGFDPESALAWRSTNYALQKAIETFYYVQEAFQSAYDSCMAVCDIGVFNLCQACTLPVIFDTIAMHAAFALSLAKDISEHLYGEIVDGQDGDAAAEQDAAVYKNVITIHGNIITTFYLLRVVAAVHGIQAGTGASRRRMQVIDCTNTTLGYVDNCSKPSCENPTRLCDGSFNYDYISRLEGGEKHSSAMGCLCIKLRVAHTINLPI